MKLFIFDFIVYKLEFHKFHYKYCSISYININEKKIPIQEILYKLFNENRNKLRCYLKFEYKMKTSFQKKKIVKLKFMNKSIYKKTYLAYVIEYL